MLPWIKHWGGWAMFEFLTRQRSGPQSQGLHYSYEKGGLILDGQPIPWNAEAVLVEATLRLPAQQPRNRDDFSLRLSPGTSQAPESLRPGDKPDLVRLFFRLTVPAQTTTVELLWRERSLGQLVLPLLSREEFLQQLSLQMPTLAVQVGEETVQCQSAVTAQCQNVLVSALMVSATNLVPILDLGLRVQMCSDKGDLVTEVPVHFSSSQLKGKQALVTVLLPRPRRSGTSLYYWLLNEQILATQKLRTITKAVVNRSLRLSATRFLLQQEEGQIKLAPVLPASLEGIERVGPCFWVSSSEPGLASWCDLEVRARLMEAGESILLHGQKVLLTDGPTPVALGTLDVGFLPQVKHFELLCQNRLLGVLPLTPVPTASFTSEGGFKPPEEFAWSPAAEEQLQEKLGRLLGGA
jgi:hypothetical protein